MAPVPVVFENANIEILAKLMNSVARKYGCRVRFDRPSRKVRFSGDEVYKPHIVEETLGLFKRGE